jgi:hypothetical protein
MSKQKPKRHRGRKRPARRRGARPARGRHTTAKAGPGDLDIQFPNEYFHTVIVESLWHPDGVVDENGNARKDVRVCMRGTGFFYRIDGADFLVTARHMFTHRAWRTNDWLDDVHSVTPTYARIQLRVEPEGEKFDAERLQFVDFLFPLVDGEDENPVWLEHPRGFGVDVAALPLVNAPFEGMHFLPLEPKDAAYGNEPRF